MNLRALITTVSIATIAGTTLPITTAAAQGQSSYMAGEVDGKTSLRFVRAEELLGSSIVNANQQVVGAVDDVLVDRGSGRLQYVVLRDGGVLGFGGKRVAIPYASFATDTAATRLRLDATPEMIEKAPEFVPENWVELESDSWGREMSDIMDRLDEDADRDLEDGYERSLRENKTETVKGRVDSVDRTGDQVIVTIRGDDTDAPVQRIVLGPTWYVMSQTAAPMRGDEVKIKAHRLTGSTDGRWIATEAEIDGEDLNLRTAEGHPQWRAERKSERRGNSDRQSPVTERDHRDSDGYMTTTPDRDRRDKSPDRVATRERLPRLIRLSELVGMDANARDEDGGDIADAVIEANSGRIALLTFDPDENFLGIGDENRVVPWPIAAIGRDAVTIDADKDMLLTCDTMPDDVQVFAQDGRLEPLYEVFKVDVVEFDARDRQEWRGATSLGGWSQDSDLAEAIEDGKDFERQGTVRGVASETLDGTSSDALTITLEGEDGPERIVVGPRWFLDKQSVSLREGDRVTVSGKSAEVNGVHLLVANKINTADGRTIELWRNNKPLWDAG